MKIKLSQICPKQSIHLSQGLLAVYGSLVLFKVLEISSMLLTDDPRRVLRR